MYAFPDPVVPVSIAIVAMFEFDTIFVVCPRSAAVFSPWAGLRVS
jgi:hypothetical protein